MDESNSGKMFVCVRVRDVPSTSILSPSAGDELHAETAAALASHRSANASNNSKPKSAAASSASVNASDVVVSVIENVVVVHDPKQLHDRSVTAKDASSLVQLLSNPPASAGNDPAGGSATIGRMLSSSSASFFDFDRCIVSMRQDSMMEMPIMRSSDFLQLPPCGTQEDVYQCTGRPAVKSVLQGINSCVFACGQTGSGKTYTLFGETSNLSAKPGVIPQALEDLFASLNATMQQQQQIINQVSQQHGGSGGASHLLADDAAFSFQVDVAFFEIYQDEIRCLLSRRGPLKLNYTDTTVSVQDLEIVPVQTRQDAMQLLEKGLLRRQTGETAMNSRSSRSHAIFQVFVTQHRTNRRTNETVVLNSTLNLVDLAGSERQKSAKTEQKGTKEGIHINQSLSTLLRVIHECSRGSKYVNYRDSTLTMVLRENLGGNSKTFMIATISPTARCYLESISTLQYAKDASRIRNRPMVNKLFQTRENLQNVNSALRSEVETLKRQLREMLDMEIVGGTTGIGKVDDASLYFNPLGTSSDSSSFPLIIVQNGSPTQTAQPSNLTALCPVLTSFVKVVRSVGSRLDIASSALVVPQSGIQVTPLDREEVYVDVQSTLTKLFQPCPDGDLSSTLLGGRLMIERVSQKECQVSYWLRLEGGDNATSQSIPPSSTVSTVVIKLNGLPQRDLAQYPQKLSHGDVIAVELEGSSNPSLGGCSDVMATLVVHFTDLNTTMRCSRNVVDSNASLLIDDEQLPAFHSANDDERERLSQQDQELSTIAHYEKDLRIRELEREVFKLRDGLQQNAMALEYVCQRSNQQSRMPSVARRSMGQTIGGIFGGTTTATSSPDVAFRQPGGSNSLSGTVMTSTGFANNEVIVDAARIACNATPLEIYAEMRSTGGAGSVVGVPLSNRVSLAHEDDEASCSPRAANVSSGKDAVLCNQRNSASLQNLETTNSMMNASFRGGTGAAALSAARLDLALEENRQLALELSKARSTVQELEDHVNYMGVVMGMAQQMPADEAEPSLPHRDDAHNIRSEVDDQGQTVSVSNTATRLLEDVQRLPSTSSVSVLTLRVPSLTRGESLRTAGSGHHCTSSTTTRSVSRLGGPTAEEIRAHTRDIKEIYNLREAVRRLEQDLDDARAMNDAAERRCADKEVDLELVKAQLQSDNAELSRALMRIGSEYDAAVANTESLRSFASSTEQRLNELLIQMDDDVSQKVEFIEAKCAALHAVARFWKRRAVAVMCQLQSGMGTKSEETSVGNLSTKHGGELALLTCSSRSQQSSTIAVTERNRVVEGTIRQFHETTNQDIVVVLEQQLQKINTEHETLQDELRQAFSALSDARTQVQHKEDEKSAALKQQQLSEEKLREKFKTAYDNKRIELEKARAREAEIARRYESLLSRKNALLSKESNNAGSLGAEQKRLIQMLQEEVATLTTKHSAQQDEILIAIRSAERNGAAKRDGKPQLEWLREKMEQLISQMMIQSHQMQENAAAVRSTQPAAGSSYHSSSVFPPSALFSEELTATVRFALRILMDQLKLELYIVNTQSLQKLTHATAAITRGDANATFQRCLMDVRGVVAEITTRATKIGDAWHVKDEDFVNLIDHRRRKLAQALLILLVWYDHWDLTPKRDYPSYIELVRNGATLVHFARVSRLESHCTTNHASSEGSGGGIVTARLPADKYVAAAVERMRDVKAKQQASKINMQLFQCNASQHPNAKAPTKSGKGPLHPLSTTLGGGVGVGDSTTAAGMDVTNDLPDACSSSSAACGDVISSPCVLVSTQLVHQADGLDHSIAGTEGDAKVELDDKKKLCARSAGETLVSSPAPDLRVDRRLNYSRSRSHEATEGFTIPEASAPSKGRTVAADDNSHDPTQHHNMRTLPMTDGEASAVANYSFLQDDKMLQQQVGGASQARTISPQHKKSTAPKMSPSTHLRPAGDGGESANSITQIKKQPKLSAEERAERVRKVVASVVSHPSFRQVVSSCAAGTTAAVMKENVPLPRAGKERSTSGSITCRSSRTSSATTTPTRSRIGASNADHQPPHRSPIPSCVPPLKLSSIVNGAPQLAFDVSAPKLLAARQPRQF